MKEYLRDLIGRALESVANAETEIPADFEIEFEQPNNPEHGDLSTNVAMKLARVFKRAPREIASDIVTTMREQLSDGSGVADIEIAGAGFINFRFSDNVQHQALATILAAAESFGRTAQGEGQRALVEFVSANPTGPLTVGHGRNAVLGDTIANLFNWCGYEVTREYYFNDAGRQMRVLGESVRARYLALADPAVGTKSIEGGTGRVTVPEPFPEDGYLGDYIEDIARDLFDREGNALVEEDYEPFKEAAKTTIFADIEATLGRLSVEMDEHFNERSLYDSGLVWETVDALRDLGMVYDKDGAVWFKTSELGKDADTVLVKSTGEPTYRLPDIAYHVDKLKRGFDLAVDVFGADHIATYPDVLAGVKLLGYDPDKIDVVIYQFVTLIRGGEPVKMSTRKATYVTLDELMDEVGEDVTRFFFLMRSPNTHLEFDLDLAREASEKNPVFYLQYAHARICSILRKAAEVGFQFSDTTDLSLLQHETELALAKELSRLPDVVQAAADQREPHRVATYLREVAVAFNQFYQHCRIIGEEASIATARMAAATATRTVLANGLRVLGITAPERM